MAYDKNDSGMHRKIKEFVDGVFPTEEIDEEDIKQEIYLEMSCMRYVRKFVKETGIQFTRNKKTKFMSFLVRNKYDCLD